MSLSVKHKVGVKVATNLRDAVNIEAACVHLFVNVFPSIVVANTGQFGNVIVSQV